MTDTERAAWAAFDAAIIADAQAAGLVDQMLQSVIMFSSDPLMGYTFTDHGDGAYSCTFTVKDAYRPQWEQEGASNERSIAGDL